MEVEIEECLAERVEREVADAFATTDAIHKSCMQEDLEEDTQFAECGDEDVHVGPEEVHFDTTRLEDSMQELYILVAGQAS